MASNYSLKSLFLTTASIAIVAFGTGFLAGDLFSNDGNDTTPGLVDEFEITMGGEIIDLSFLNNVRKPIRKKTHEKAEAWIRNAGTYPAGNRDFEPGINLSNEMILAIVKFQNEHKNKDYPGVRLYYANDVQSIKYAVPWPMIKNGAGKLVRENLTDASQQTTYAVELADGVGAPCPILCD